MGEDSGGLYRRGWRVVDRMGTMGRGRYRRGRTGKDSTGPVRFGGV